MHPNNVYRQQRNMKRFLSTLMMIAITATAFCQRYPVEELNEWRAQLIGQSTQAFTTLKLESLRDENLYFWDGNNMYILTDSGDENGEFLWMNDWTNKVITTVVPKGTTGIMQDTGLSFTIHQAGDMRVLELMESGKLSDLMVEVKNNQEIWRFIDLHDMLDGLYTTPDGKQYVFGLPEMFEGVERDITDPGIFDVTRREEEQLRHWEYVIDYGEGRISHGTYVEDPEKRNMPGAGGAGALMGPMTWAFNLTNYGVEGKVLRDEPTVDHYPDITEDFQLTKVQSPFKNVQGLWPITSLRPLNYQMLRNLPKDILRLMRNEIYARHGEKFTSDASIQAYFDQQSWYKALPKASQLTGLERLNVRLIKAVEDSKK